jgi:Bacterial EndoU nuclease
MLDSFTVGNAVEVGLILADGAVVVVRAGGAIIRYASQAAARRAIPGILFAESQALRTTATNAEVAGFIGRNPAAIVRPATPTAGGAGTAPAVAGNGTAAPVVGGATTPNIDFAHIINGNINSRGVGTGGHYLRSPDVRVTQVTGPVNAQGVSQGYIQVRDLTTGRWIDKPTETTFFPTTWTQNQLRNEVTVAFQNSRPTRVRNQWEGTSPSGIVIRGYYTPNGGASTAYPVYVAPRRGPGN